MADTWTIREVAAAAGRSPDTASALARRGLLPGYAARRYRIGAGIPEPLAEAFVTVLRTGAASQRLAGLMRENPAEVLDAAEALAVLARTAMESPRLAERRERKAA